MNPARLYRSLVFRRMVGRVRRSVVAQHHMAGELRLSTLRHLWHTADSCATIRGLFQ